MKAFAALLDNLLYAPARNVKLRLIADYLSRTPDPDRGYALAALTGALDFAHAKPAAIRALVVSRVDPVLFALSYDYVGDLAETAALIWPAPAAAPEGTAPRLSDIVEALRGASRTRVPDLLANWCDGLDATGRWALLKLVTGGLRVGVSAQLARAALAQWSGRNLSAIEQVWHGQQPPYIRLFAWLEGRGPEPAVSRDEAFLPMMLAQPLDESELAAFDPRGFRAEWKWDGIRVQLVAGGGAARLYSRTGDDIGASFPDMTASPAFEGVLDGELLVRRGAELGSFNDLQQRLNRKRPSARLVAEFPAFVRLYDLLCEGAEDLRALPFDTRRARLEAWCARQAEDRDGRFDLSPLIAFASWDELRALRTAAPRGSEGVMLKRADSPYLAGRPKGPWFKWKRNPMTVDAVLMYAQRGHGKRSSFYSDFTFGCWRNEKSGGRELVPVAKAYFGFSDAELKRLDRFVREHTVERFGPVREVEKSLVVELAFDGAQRSSRHKSGIALRFPRVSRIRWDKPAAEADELGALAALIDA